MWTIEFTEIRSRLLEKVQWGKGDGAVFFTEKVFQGLGMNPEGVKLVFETQELAEEFVRHAVPVEEQPYLKICYISDIASAHRLHPLPWVDYALHRAREMRAAGDDIDKIIDEMDTMRIGGIGAKDPSVYIAAILGVSEEIARRIVNNRIVVDQ